MDRGFWAGSRSGQFLGTIEERMGEFVAFDSTHRILGRFALFDAALEAVAAG